MPKLLPATGGELHGISVTNTTTLIPGERDRISRTESGPTGLMEVRLAYWRSHSIVSKDILSIIYNEGSGRATLTTEFASTINPQSLLQNEKYGVQELRGTDTVKDIQCHPYFKTLTVDQKAIVKVTFEELGTSTIPPAVAIDWNNLQKTLWNHYLIGITSYVDTAYVLTCTYQVSSLMNSHKSALNANKVVPLPELSPTLENLIDDLPQGEWLQKPIEVMYAGRTGWTIRLTYMYADQWSVIYGGTLLAP